MLGLSHPPPRFTDELPREASYEVPPHYGGYVSQRMAFRPHDNPRAGQPAGGAQYPYPPGLPIPANAVNFIPPPPGLSHPEPFLHYPQELPNPGGLSHIPPPPGLHLSGNAADYLLPPPPGLHRAESAFHAPLPQGHPLPVNAFPAREAARANARDSNPPYPLPPGLFHVRCPDPFSHPPHLCPALRNVTPPFLFGAQAPQRGHMQETGHVFTNVACANTQESSSVSQPRTERLQVSVEQAEKELRALLLQLQSKEKTLPALIPPAPSKRETATIYLKRNVSTSPFPSPPRVHHSPLPPEICDPDSSNDAVCSANASPRETEKPLARSSPPIRSEASLFPNPDESIPMTSSSKAKRKSDAVSPSSEELSIPHSTLQTLLPPGNQDIDIFKREKKAKTQYSSQFVSPPLSMGSDSSDPAPQATSHAAPNGNASGDSRKKTYAPSAQHPYVPPLYPAFPPYFFPTFYPPSQHGYAPLSGFTPTQLPPLLPSVNAMPFPPGIALPPPPYAMQSLPPKGYAPLFIPYFYNPYYSVFPHRNLHMNACIPPGPTVSAPAFQASPFMPCSSMEQRVPKHPMQ